MHLTPPLQPPHGADLVLGDLGREPDGAGVEVG